MGSGTPRFETPVQMRAVAGKRTLEMQLCRGKGTGAGGGFVRGLRGREHSERGKGLGEEREA